MANITTTSPAASPADVAAAMKKFIRKPVQKLDAEAQKAVDEEFEKLARRQG